MSVLQKIFLLCMMSIFMTFGVSAASVDQLRESISEYSLNIPEKLYVEDTLEIDITNLWETLSQSYWDFELEYEWEIFSLPPQQWPILSATFNSFWEKAVELQIFTTQPASISEDWEEIPQERVLIYRSSKNVFVYEKSFPVIIDVNIDENKKENFISSAQEQWILVYSLWEFSEDTISWDEIIQNLSTYRLSFSEKSDYITLWWKREFIFSILSRLNTRSLESASLNLVLLTSYNTSVLKNYITNSISWKTFINMWFIVDESVRTQILNNPQSIDSLLTEIWNNSYEYTLLTDVNPIESYFFISRFISKLSNNWVALSDIYIILLLPLFLTIVWVAKHFIWFSTLGSVIPIFIWILYIKLWVPFTLGLLLFLLIINIAISKLISKYTLLYTPKVTFITIINFLVFMGMFLIFDDMEIIAINLDNIIYIIIFFVVAEKFITIVASKEFREYKKSFSWTIIVSLLCFGLFNFTSFLVFLTAYPELLVILIPFNFMLWRFTGLRITEYFRFREIIKNVEE